jgi:uncharacterized membrane protein
VIEPVLEFLENAGIAISLFAVAVIVVGFAVAAWRYARRFRHTTHEDNFNVFKGELGIALLVGLEVLVLAEVIRTITISPTFSSLAILLAVVVVRTAVSWNLTLSIKGRWPWQTPVEDRGSA